MNWGALIALAALVSGCAGEIEGFDAEEQEDSAGLNAKAYRSGCSPIRTGTYAVRGDVITPSAVLVRGYVVVDGEKIAEVRTSEQGPPDKVPVYDSQGVIAPGLIDGHSHVEYNHIPLADFGKRFGNRDQWPNVKLYQELVKAPKNAITAAGLKCQALKHGEVRALVGGTTAIQGTPEMACVRPLARNLEQTNFCQDRVRQNVANVSDFGRSISGRPSFADSIKADLAADKLDAVVVHLGEGIDDHARAEWPAAKALGLALSEFVMIHATALTPADLNEASAVGAKIVWSPLSNYLLYGATNDVPAGLAAGVLVSLGTDWAPSGSANLLGELKAADRVNKGLWGGQVTDEQLVRMATLNPAIAYGLDAHIGSIAAGKAADLIVVKKQAKVTAYRSLIDARPGDVYLVTVSGDPLFGTQGAMDQLGKAGDYEIIDACGEPRAIDVTVIAADVPGAGESLASIEEKLRVVNPRLTPVIDCTDDEITKAFAGTPLEGVAP